MQEFDFQAVSIPRLNFKPEQKIKNAPFFLYFPFFFLLRKAKKEKKVKSIWGKMEGGLTCIFDPLIRDGWRVVTYKLRSTTQFFFNYKYVQASRGEIFGIGPSLIEYEIRALFLQQWNFDTELFGGIQ